MIVVVNSRQFGTNLEYLRKQQGYSRWKLATMLGIRWGELFSIEKGSLRDIEYDVLLKICEVLKIEMEKIIHSDLKQNK